MFSVQIPSVLSIETKKWSQYLTLISFQITRTGQASEVNSRFTTPRRRKKNKHKNLKIKSKNIICQSVIWSSEFVSWVLKSRSWRHNSCLKIYACIIFNTIIIGIRAEIHQTLLSQYSLMYLFFCRARPKVGESDPRFKNVIKKGRSIGKSTLLLKW